MCRPDDFPPYDTAYPATVLDADDPPEYEDEMSLAHRIKEEALVDGTWCNGHPDNSFSVSRVCEHGRLLPHVIDRR